MFVNIKQELLDLNENLYHVYVESHKGIGGGIVFFLNMTEGFH